MELSASDRLLPMKQRKRISLLHLNLTWVALFLALLIPLDTSKSEGVPKVEAVEAVSVVEQPVAPVEPEKPVQSTCEAEIAKYGWNVSVAMAVSRAESGLRADARGDTHLTYYRDGIRYGDSWGCFQVRYLPGRPTPTQLTDPIQNVSYAYNLYKANGWKPWSVCNKGIVRCY